MVNRDTDNPFAEPSDVYVSRQVPVLEKVLGVWNRRKWLAIPIIATLLSAVVSVVMFLPNVYRSTATILVERQKVPEAFVQSTVTSGIDIRLQTITQQILSRSRLESLIERFNLYSDMRELVSLEQVLGRMRQDIQLEYKGGHRRRNDPMTAFSISYHGSDPQVVAQVTNTLASFYIEENLKVREQQAAGTAEFLRVQLQKMKSELEEQERRLSQFKERHIGELPGQLQANLVALEQLNTQLRLNSERQARLGEQQAALTQQLAELDRLGPSSTPLTAATPESDVVRLEQLRQELRVLRTHFTDTYPDIVRLKAVIETLEHDLAEAVHGKEPDTPQTSRMNPYILQLREQLGASSVELKTLQAQERSLLHSITLYQTRVENTPRREQELHVLLRDYGTSKELYQSLLKRQEEAKLAESLEQRQQGEQFRLLEPAVPATQPAAPNRRKLALIGLVLTFGLAAGVMIGAEQLDSSFPTVHDLRAFSPVPVLVNLPHLVTTADVRRRQRRFGLVTIATILGSFLIVGAAYITLKGPTELLELLTHVQHLWP